MIRPSFAAACSAAVLLLVAGQEPLRAQRADSIVVFSEIHYNPAGGATEWIELRNLNAIDVDLSGWSVRGGIRYRFPSGTILKGEGFAVVARDPAAIPGAFGPFEGALNNAGDTLALHDNSGRFMDGLTYLDRGRWPAEPDGAGPSLAKRTMYSPSADPESWSPSSQAGGTPGAENFPDGPPPRPDPFQPAGDVVINEICYHVPARYETETTPFEDRRLQWIELYNRTAAPVDIGGWTIQDGIDYVIPGGTTLPPGGYFVVTNDPAGFAAAYPGVPASGPWSGNLSRSGERIALHNAADVVVDEVRYHDGGYWPEEADGGGSTLELRHPDADNSLPSSWAASRTTSGWATYTYTGTAAPSRVGPDNRWREFVMGLLSDGEILMDDIMVTETPNGTPVPMIVNGDFEDGSTGWRFRGTHRHSEVIPDPDNPSNHVLRLVATGPPGHLHNLIETTLADNRAVTNGREYEIRFRARWISGSGRLNTRLYFNRLARTTLLPRQEWPGTPGAANSQAVAFLGPGFREFTHSPAVPPANQPATVSVRADDPDGVDQVTLYYSVNGGGFAPVAMTRGDGDRFTATVPGQAAGAVVQFYVQARDTTGAISFCPPAGPASRALYQVEDGRASTNALHTFRIVMTPDDRTWMHRDINAMSDDRIGCTVIYREQEIFYDAGVRIKGSQRARTQQPRIGYNVEFNPGQLFRGAHRTVAIDRSQGVESGQIEVLFNVMMTSAGGVSGRYSDLIKVVAPNNSYSGSAELQMARYNDVFLSSQFENGDDGTVFEYELIYYPTTADQQGNKRPQPDEVVGTAIRNLGDTKENYRWNLLIKGNRERDDYSRIMAYAKHFSLSSTAFNEGLEDVMNVDQWLRGMAFAVLSGAGDNYGAGDQHNGQFYVGTDGRVTFLPHDMDFSFSTSRSITANPDVAKIVGTAGSPPIQNARLRLYLGHLHDIITTTYNAEYMSYWTSHFGALLPGQNFNAHRSYIISRSNNVLSQINSRIPPVDFGITTASPLAVASGPAVIEGDGWVNVRSIRIAGSPVDLDVTWTDRDSWSVAVPVNPGAQQVQLEALDFRGNVIGSASIAVNSAGTIPLASAESVVISELHYHPADPSSAEAAAGFGDADDFEFVELQNISGGPVDLSLAAFTEGIDFRIPAGTVLQPGQYLLLVRNREAFSMRYPDVPADRIAGEYSGNLANSGETIALTTVYGADIRRFAWQDAAPWPAAADGDGPSLVLVNPSANPDHSLPASWQAGAGGRAHPNEPKGGGGGESPYAAWKAEHGIASDADDSDGDGVPAVLEFFHGRNPASADAGGDFTAARLPDGTLRFLIRRSLSAAGVAPTIEASTDLTEWTPVAVTPVSQTPDGSGAEILTFDAPAIPAAPPRQYFRASVVLPP